MTGSSDGFAFEIQKASESSSARCGVWHTPHGTVETPAFMPVGTRGTVRGLWPEQLVETGAEMVLANTYHLALRPGAEVVEELGGLHRFMQWDGPILTDSGGFQVFSLAEMARLTDDGVSFKSHIDGSWLELTPERAVSIQEQLGADCIMCLDECPSHEVPIEKLRQAVDRTTDWARRCRDAQKRTDQALMGIIQGGTDPAERERSAEGLLKLEFPGYAIGGLSVGESPESMYKTLDVTTPMLPTDRPRYLMGVGTPRDLFEAVVRGIDLFDCVMPTRNGRSASAFTVEGEVRLKNRKYRTDERPLDPGCECRVCTRFSRGYLRHLFLSREMLGPILVSYHNLVFYQNFLRSLRDAIRSDRLDEFRSLHLAEVPASL
ncbi:MAG TPA: tRNA guanosine(34) transglycosylase Tgt [Planctomycetaceae bacterium]|nr:tRNA guanosine(34) transglycosylase Tgt [Planctomycetaceae bacterium]